MMPGLRAALCLLALILVGAPAARAAEIIHSFDSDVSVARDGELTVSETIRVRAEGYEIRRGIYRDFPLTFRDAAGSLHEVTFSLVGVSRDGHAEPYHTERKNGVLRIYAGDKDVIIPHGDHTYVFRYRTGRQLRWFDGKPELNWNVTGNFWRFPILAAHYRLTLPGGVRPVRYTAYTGRLGARGTDWEGGLSSLGVLSVDSTRRLTPGEGLTVVAEIPADAVEPPSASTLLWYQLLDNRAWIFGGGGFIVVLIYYLAAWRAVGRDPKRGTVIALFHPPQGISPALANYIHNWGLAREKWRAFTAACLSLATRGLLRMDNSGGGLTLKLTGKDAPGGVALAAEERAIVTRLASKGGTAVIDRAHGTDVAELGNKFTAAVETGNRNRFFRRNLAYVFVGVAMTIGLAIGIANFGGLQDQDIAILAFLGFGGFFVGVFAVPVVTSLFGGATFTGAVRGVMSVAVIAIFFAIGTNILHTLSPASLSEAVPALTGFVEAFPFSFVLVAAFTTLNGLFLYLMRAPTALGRPIMDQLDGFKLYMETAEKERLNYQAPEFTAERFEALLPYAVALDVEKPWSEAFAAALRRAHPEDADPMRHYQPSWSSGGSWSSGNFSGAVAATVASTSSALASAVPVSSGSSGFSGGGGSGGGGGGGGGGGW